MQRNPLRLEAWVHWDSDLETMENLIRQVAVSVQRHGQIHGKGKERPSHKFAHTSSRTSTNLITVSHCFQIAYDY